MQCSIKALAGFGVATIGSLIIGGSLMITGEALNDDTLFTAGTIIALSAIGIFLLGFFAQKFCENDHQEQQTQRNNRGTSWVSSS